MGRAPRFLRHDRMHESHGFYNRQGRLKGFRRHLCAMRTTSTVGCAPRFLWRDRMHESHGFYNCQGRLKKIYQLQAGYLYPTFVSALMLVLQTSVGFENPTSSPQPAACKKSPAC